MLDKPFVSSDFSSDSINSQKRKIKIKNNNKTNKTIEKHKNVYLFPKKDNNFNISFKKSLSHSKKTNKNHF